MEPTLSSSEISILMNTPLATAFAELLATYTISQENKLELVIAVSQENEMRKYHSFSIEGEFEGDLEIVFSLYSNKMGDGEPDQYEPLVVEFLQDGDNVEHEQLYLEQFYEALEAIKADLIKNSFPVVEV